MTITRRDFLAASLGTSTLVALGSGVPGFLARIATAAAATRNPRDTILIVVQLSGGNDGLNTVVPYGDDGYGRNRTTLRLPAAGLHKIDALLGFHPEMEGFARLYNEGHLTIVQGVGYPNHSQQHPVAMRDWQTAQPEQAEHPSRVHAGARSKEQSGWLGRTADRAIGPGDPTVPAVFVGQGKRPFSLNAEQAVVPSLRGLDDWILQQPSAVPADPAVPGMTRDGAANSLPSPFGRGAGGEGLLDFVTCASDAAQRERADRVDRPRSIDVRSGRLSAVSTGGHVSHDHPTDPCRPGDPYLLRRTGRTTAGRFRQPCRPAR